MIRVGFIGTGGVSKHHRTSVGEIEGMELAWVFDTNPESAKKAAELSGAESCASASEVIEKCDAVYILTFLFQSGPQPPAPYPDTGLDETEDDLDCETSPF